MNEMYQKLLQRVKIYRRLQNQYLKTGSKDTLESARATAIVVNSFARDLKGSCDPEDLRFAKLVIITRGAEERFYASRSRADLIRMRILQKQLDKFIEDATAMLQPVQG
jgi:hypothetical protein